MVLPLALSFARSLRSHRLLPAYVAGPRPHMSVAASSGLSFSPTSFYCRVPFAAALSAVVTKKAPDSQASRNACAISGSNWVPAQRSTSSAA